MTKLRSLFAAALLSVIALGALIVAPAAASAAPGPLPDPGSKVNFRIYNTNTGRCLSATPSSIFTLVSCGDNNAVWVVYGYRDDPTFQVGNLGQANICLGVDPIGGSAGAISCSDEFNARWYFDQLSGNAWQLRSRHAEYFGWGDQCLMDQPEGYLKLGSCRDGGVRTMWSLVYA
ncbi:hypothetical protein F0L68_35875 [Solihabitans fulvus]|uniref:Ricin-type beta-trefoil lectin domain-containing protein n=1 Tax=Solihabitans fulvus TaxID=1892852 RepID=A0A5B2WNZ6_9PSEU|nr:hypothetical protein [Solihabitans fulvus]KAA2252422.1 hypothetical protein F0L68_35875 [Solihabitans fulvus]